MFPGGNVSQKFCCCWKVFHEHTEGPKNRRAKQFPASQTQFPSTSCLIRREEVLCLAQGFTAALHYPVYILNTSPITWATSPPSQLHSLHRAGESFPPNSKEQPRQSQQPACSPGERRRGFSLPNKTSPPSQAQPPLDVDLSCWLTNHYYPC